MLWSVMECYTMNGITEKGSGADHRGQHVRPALFWPLVWSASVLCTQSTAHYCCREPLEAAPSRMRLACFSCRSVPRKGHHFIFAGVCALSGPIIPGLFEACSEFLLPSVIAYVKSEVIHV